MVFVGAGLITASIAIMIGCLATRGDAEMLSIEGW